MSTPVSLPTLEVQFEFVNSLVVDLDDEEVISELIS